MSYQQSTPECDVEVSNCGTIVLFEPLTDEGRDWIAENIDDSAMWFAGALAVEARFAANLAEGMKAGGLEVRS